MKKRLLTALAAGIILIFTFTTGVFAGPQGVNLIINGKKVDAAGLVQDGRVLAPLEELVRALGGTFEWSPENGTAYLNLPGLNGPAVSDLKDSCAIKVNKITEGISTLTLSGVVTNTSDAKLSSLTVYGKLLAADGRELTRTYICSVSPEELGPGQTGAFEITFFDYDKFKSANAKYGVYVQGFSL